MAMEAVVMAVEMAEYMPAVGRMVIQPRQPTKRTRMETSYGWMARFGSV